MPSKRKPSLAALAKSRGYGGVSASRNFLECWKVSCVPSFSYAPCCFSGTRRSAEAGLRAALEALPPVKARHD